jgi:hypothetical protein
VKVSHLHSNQQRLTAQTKKDTVSPGEATDVIAACDRRLEALGAYFGRESPEYRAALATWHHQLSRLFSMSMGADTHISRDGDLSLLVRTGSGLVFGIIFHGVGRRCTTDGCTVTIRDDGTAYPAYSGAPALDHRHTPSYPLDAPRPGEWSFHS